MMTGVGASLSAAAGSPARAYLDDFEADAADRHVGVAVPVSPPGTPATLDSMMAQMAIMTGMLQKMAEDSEEMKLKVKALEAFVMPGADPWQPGLASRPADSGGRPAAPPGVAAVQFDLRSPEQSEAGSQDGDFNTVQAHEAAALRRHNRANVARTETGGPDGWTVPERLSSSTRIPSTAQSC